jgi:site-specific DNA-methyltransferase (adenine-specific)
VVHGECLAVLRALPAECARLVYLDPPFNTGRRQRRLRLRTVRDEQGDRRGFQGHRYRTLRLGSTSFADVYDDYLGFLEPRLRETHRILSPDGALFLHVDYREVHYCKVLLDQIFGREAFLNEIIWAYDYGARTRTRWPAKHQNLLWYVRDPGRYVFNHEATDRIPYLAPGLVGPEKAARGKTPTDVWWQTIVSPTGREATGYPTQKPLALLERIVRVHSDPGDLLLDAFAGSGTLGEAAARNGRDFLLIDHGEEAIAVMRRRLSIYGAEFVDATLSPLSASSGL